MKTEKCAGCGKYTPCDELWESYTRDLRCLECITGYPSLED